MLTGAGAAESIAGAELTVSCLLSAGAAAVGALESVASTATAIEDTTDGAIIRAMRIYKKILREMNDSINTANQTIQPVSRLTFGNRL